MKRARVSVVGPAVVLTIAYAVAVAIGVPGRSLATRVYLVAVAALACRVLDAVASTAPRTPRWTGFDRAARGTTPPRPRVPKGLQEADRLVTAGGGGTAADVHFRLRPALRELSAQRLATGHGLDLDRPEHAEAVAALCGPALWGVVRPDRPVPEDRTGPALGHRVVPEVVGALERL